MPKLYEYFGLRVYFTRTSTNPFMCTASTGRESKAEIIIVNGEIVEIRFGGVSGMKPLEGRALADFKVLVTHRAMDIVNKWVEFFVHRKAITTERITRRLK